MSRKHGRTDSNQTEIVAAFRQMGCSVKIQSDVGNGWPDTEIGVNGVNCLVEIKSKDGKLTVDQQEFFKSWQGMARVIRSVDEAVELANFMRVMLFVRGLCEECGAPLYHIEAGRCTRCAF